MKAGVDLKRRLIACSRGAEPPDVCVHPDTFETYGGKLKCAVCGAVLARPKGEAR